MNLLLDGTTNNNIGNIILVAVLLVACVAMFVLSYIKNKKYMQNQQDLLADLKVGSKVLTKTFIYGTIEKITETTDGKIVLIKTGEDDKCSYIEMNIDGIYSVDKKEEVVDVDSVMSGEDDQQKNEAETEDLKQTVEAFEVEEEVETDNKPKRKPKTKK